MTVVLLLVGIVLFIGGIYNIVKAKEKGRLTAYSENTWRATGIFCLIAAVFVVGISIYILSNSVSGSSSGRTSYSSSSEHKCTICRKPATNQFQGSWYCDSDYQDAIIWAMNHTK